MIGVVIIGRVNQLNSLEECMHSGDGQPLPVIIEVRGYETATITMQVGRRSQRLAVNPDEATALAALLNAAAEIAKGKLP